MERKRQRKKARKERKSQIFTYAPEFPILNAIRLTRYGTVSFISVSYNMK
jgi:hypothetical protein